MTDEKKVKVGLSMHKKQKIAIYACCAAIILLSITLILVNYFTGIQKYTETDSQGNTYTYYIKQKDGVYVLCDEDGYTVSKTPDGYYATENNLLSVDEETGKWSTFASVAVSDEEQVGFNNRILIYKYISRNDIASIEVHNEYGSYTVKSDGKTEEGGVKFIIDGYPLASIDNTMLSSLVTSAGYTLAMEKISNEALEKYGLGEYGLVNTENYFTITDMSGKSYTMFIGNLIPSGSGYYVRRSGFNAVYILSKDISKALLAPVENLATPMIVYPTTLTTYFNVKDFMLTSYTYDEAGEIKSSDLMVWLSFWDMADRQNTEYSGQPYVMNGKKLGGYIPNSNNVDTALQHFYNMSFIGVKSLTISDEAIAKYDLSNPKYIMAYDYIVYEGTSVTNTIPTLLYISNMTENGTYYVASPLFEQIVEVDRYQFEFLAWDSSKWIESAYFQLPLLYCTDITIDAPDYNLSIKLDNSESESNSTTNIIVTASENSGNYKRIENVDNFRNYYKTMLYASFAGRTEHTAEEIENIVSDESNYQLTMTIHSSTGRELKFTFYKDTTLKSLVKVGEDVEFYVLTERVNKFISDAKKLYKGEIIDPIAQN